MGECYITRRGTKTGGATEQLGIYPTGSDGRPTGNVTVLDNVTTLSKYPFIENDNVLTIALPENLINLADYCFQKCTNLQNVSIPNKVTAIPKYCFGDCTKLTSINIPDKVTTIGEKAFYNCTNLTSVIVSENAKYTIGQYAFNKSGLTDSCVTDIVSHASTINPHIFDECKSLINVVVPAFANYMFSNCVNLKTAKSTGSSTISSTGAYTFYNSTQLESVVIADGTTTIENCVFRACTSLKTVYLPSSIKSFMIYMGKKFIIQLQIPLVHLYLLKSRVVFCGRLNK